jgi:hypothetical protein
VVLKNRYLSLVLLSAALVLPASASMASGYSPDEFLSLDPSKALLSPTPLGPANAFVPVPAKAHMNGDVAGPQARAEPLPAPRHARVLPAPRHARVEIARVAKPHGAARIRLAHRHHSPLDAEARDTRIQAWPCKSGGICDWKQ